MNGKSGIIKRLMLIILKKCEFPWNNSFANINVNKQVRLSTQTIQNTISNYISRETIVSVMTEIHPRWVDDKLDRHRSCTYNAYSQYKNITDLFS